MPSNPQKKCEHFFTIKADNQGICMKCGFSPTQPDLPKSYRTPTEKPDTESWEKDFDEFWAKLAGNTRLSLVQSSKVKDFIHQVSEKAYQRGLHKGYEEEAVGCHEHCKEARQSTLREIMEMVEEYFDKDQKVWDKASRSAPDSEAKMYCEGSIGKILVAKKDLLSKIKEKLQ